jgi:hypothetical protein
MINPASLFLNSAPANSLDVVEALRTWSDALASKVVDHGREGDPGIPLDQGTGKT